MDTLIWAFRFCRTRPSLLALAVMFVLSGARFSRSFLEPTIETLQLLIQVGIALFLRAYVSGLVADEDTVPGFHHATASVTASDEFSSPLRYFWWPSVS